ncbi:hypothetical protein [Streptomyces canus]|nr:hypothetical protein [Streptomyces canus]
MAAVESAVADEPGRGGFEKLDVLQLFRAPRGDPFQQLRIHAP